VSDNPIPQVTPVVSVLPVPERPNVDATMQVLYASDPALHETRTR
jgi:hypothetical protein